MSYPVLMPVAADAATMDLKKTAKRDYLVALEKKAQQSWRSQKLFATDAPPLPEGTSSYLSIFDSPNYVPTTTPTSRSTFDEIRDQHPKWFGNTPYPYMNGALHLGHAFTLTKVEFAAGFERMLGKRTLFPWAFHLTGLPIKASADKLVREMALFGEDFSRYGFIQEEDLTSVPDVTSSTTVAAKLAAADDAAAAAARAAPEPAVSSDPSKGKKGKLMAKSTGLKYQFQILELLGVELKDIHKFADPRHWMDVFPPICVENCDDLGSRIDWRRAFVTTDVNPYYDSFVRWQTNKLHAQGRIKFGERYTIFSSFDDQPCMDHDRASGEGVGPQEYTAVKMEVIEWSDRMMPENIKAVGGRKVYFVAGTLRPETMYGQTNCFVGHSIQYGIYAVSPTEAYLMTPRAAKNMAYQGVFEKRGEAKKLVDVFGGDLMGAKLKPPFGVYPEVYVLPMEGVLANKGTGVVTCVPSDSPDDYATLMDLRKKWDYFGILEHWAANEPVPVISTPKYGDLIAKKLVTDMKIQSPKDKAKLAEAKEIAYKEGFYNGTMIFGEFKGDAVEVAKPKVRQQLIDAGLAFAYAEPENSVVSRSGDECIVALCDQWYLDYGEAEWKAKAELLLSRMNTYFPETRNAFEAVLNWLNQWACARSYGLGSKLPWDPQFLVESLSDSTVYMSYYTVSYLLQGGNIFGDTVGPSGLSAAQMTDDAWEFVLGSGATPKVSPEDQEKLAQLKYNFHYFYPMDVRSSGKDLIPNHLTFCMYVHAALFPEDKWPLSIRANGHLMLNGKKMSKSTGNFLTLGEAIKKYGADATRLTLADGGDDISDANFEELTANAAILRLHTLSEWASEVKTLRAEGKFRKGEYESHDKAFKVEMDALIAQTKKAYAASFYKDALKSGFYEFLTARDWYRDITLPENGGNGMHEDLLVYCIRMLALTSQPIIPHFSEFLWMDILEEKTSVQKALWPEVEVDADAQTVLEQLAYMRGVLSTMRSAESQIARKKSKGKAVAYDPAKPRSARIYVAANIPSWQALCMDVVQECWDESGGKTINDTHIRPKMDSKGLLKDKRAMPFLQNLKRKLLQQGPHVLKRGLPYSEVDTLTTLLPYIKSSMKFVDVNVVSTEDALKALEAGEAKEGELGWDKAIIEKSEPGMPETVFWNV